MKKKSKYLLIIILISLITGIVFYYFKSKNHLLNTNQNSNYNSLKVSDLKNISNNTSSEADNVAENNALENALSENNTSIEGNVQNNNSLQTNTSNAENVNSNNLNEEKPKENQSEVEIASFSTKIYTKEKNRQNNLSLTCSKLNNTYVNNGETFSFCNTVGKATSDKGYKKADVFKDGEKTKALGGGNCQISTTLYNAILKVPELKVTERHEHSNSVPYIGKGKDAAVAYGSYDLKFVNNTGKKIKIQASCDKNYVYIKLLSFA